MVTNKTKESFYQEYSSLKAWYMMNKHNSHLDSVWNYCHNEYLQETTAAHSARLLHKLALRKTPCRAVRIS